MSPRPFQRWPRSRDFPEELPYMTLWSGLFSKSTRAPRAAGEPYDKGKRKKTPRFFRKELTMEQSKRFTWLGWGGGQCFAAK